MRVVSTFFIVSLTFFSCQKTPGTPERHEVQYDWWHLGAFRSEMPCDMNDNTKMLKFETFSITVPCHWKIDTVRGIDTPPIHIIKTGEGSWIHSLFCFGYNMNSNAEHKPVLSTDLLDSMLTNYRDTSRYRFAELRPHEIQQEDFYKFKDEYTIIDGVNAKITTLKSGYGIVEINFEGLYPDPLNNKMGLCIIGHDLNRRTDSLLRQAFKTIKFLSIEKE